MRKATAVILARDLVVHHFPALRFGPAAALVVLVAALRALRASAGPRSRGFPFGLLERGFGRGGVLEEVAVEPPARPPEHPALLVELRFAHLFDRHLYFIFKKKNNAELQVDGGEKEADLKDGECMP